eukprot:5931811-Pleurochrysis_carterae.AAC.1
MAEAPMAEDSHVCGACSQVMCDMDGKPRAKTERIAHSCSHCNASLHSAVMCKFVWMPTLKNGGRTFCSKEH